MATDPRFFATPEPRTLAEIAAVAGSALPALAERHFTGVGALLTAGPTEVSFLDNRRLLSDLAATRAGAVLLAPVFADRAPVGCVAIPTAAPYLGFARVAALFQPPVAPNPGIHPTAVIGAGASIGKNCEIGPYAVIGAGAEIGPGCLIAAHVVVGPGVVLGADCRLHPHSSISHTIAGRGVVLHPGARVGQEGFGFVPTPEGRFVTIPQLGRVLLGDEVEVGANSCIDRGAQGDTVIGPGSRLDNQVQIGHNVQAGRGCVIVSQVGISGSAVLGDFVTVAGQAGIAGHLQIGSGVRIGAQAGVMQDVPTKIDVIGSPALPVKEFWRMYARLKQFSTTLGGKGKAD